MSGLLTVKEFAEKTNRTIETVRRWIHNQTINALQHPISKQYEIPESELQKVQPKEVVPSTELKGE
jgi:excisionase family DNA binding protein